MAGRWPPPSARNVVKSRCFRRSCHEKVKKTSHRSAFVCFVRTYWVVSLSVYAGRLVTPSNESSSLEYNIFDPQSSKYVDDGLELLKVLPNLLQTHQTMPKSPRFYWPWLGHLETGVSCERGGGAGHEVGVSCERCLKFARPGTSSETTKLPFLRKGVQKWPPGLPGL